MLDDPLPGYTGKVRIILEKAGAKVGDRIKIIKEGKIFEGILMPREKLYPRPIIVLKLDNGYNIGVRVTDRIIIEKLGGHERRPLPQALEMVRRTGYPHIIIASTGGTIASRVDYETGAVKPALTSRDLATLVPEVFDIADIDTSIIFNIFSENLEPKHWEHVVEKTHEFIEKGYDGIVLTHGTDTMHYTAAALSFALRGLPVPVILVGSQRSSDRPSSDAAFNLISAVLAAAKAPFSEVAVVMHGETGDTYALAHRGVKVRKMHTSRRDAFQSINDIPLARIYPYDKKIVMLREDYVQRDPDRSLRIENGFDPRVALVKFYPSITSEVIDFYIDKRYHGIVLEGTGLGHFPIRLVESIRRAVEEEIPVVMTSQCLFGRINMHVYSTGRRYLEAGVIPGEDMLPEVAYVKLSWILARTQNLNEVRKLMLSNLVGEINSRHNIHIYPRWYHGD